ncbi:hypothetical protein SNEBB_008387 [Seison nebaliae]|nr:hypothetical protein SNEBB_008387 [Seison nebaliae]
MSENSERIIESYSRVAENDLDERNVSRLFYGRNLNNWIKATLINESLCEFYANSENVRLLDVGCGKGGDLLKYKNHSIIKEITCSDLCESSINICRSRVESLDINHKNFHFDVSNVSQNDFLSTCGEKTFNLISCQFNISMRLERNGIFFGITADAEMILNLLGRKGKAITESIISMENGKRFGRISYTSPIIHIETKFPVEINSENKVVEWKCGNGEPPPLIGSEIMFSLHNNLVNCPEYLCYFPFLVDVAESFGLILIKSKLSIDHVYMNQQRHKRLLRRMKAMEEQNGRNSATISPDDWELVSLYRTFRFRKI